MMNTSRSTTRRDFMKHAGSMALCGGFAGATDAAPPHGRKPKSVAAVMTAYEHGLHSDVLVGKILDGWKDDGGLGPALVLSSMYVDQFSPRDLARAQSRKHNVPIFPTIEGALTQGGDRIPVDGVI